MCEADHRVPVNFGDIRAIAKNDADPAPAGILEALGTDPVEDTVIDSKEIHRLFLPAKVLINA